MKREREGGEGSEGRGRKHREGSSVERRERKDGGRVIHGVFPSCRGGTVGH